MAYSCAEYVVKWFLVRDREQESLGSDGISNLKMQSLLYYAQGCTFSIMLNPLFDDDIITNDFGVVVASVDRKYKKFERTAIPYEEFNVNIFDSNIIRVLEEVYQNFSQFSAWKLSEMIRQEDPWQLTKKSGDLISLDYMKDYFDKNYIERSIIKQ